MDWFRLLCVGAACGTLAACAPDVVDELGNLKNPTEYFVINSSTFTNAPSAAAPFGRDPVATGWVWAEDLPENLFVAGGRNYSLVYNDYTEWARVSFYNPYALLSGVMTYPVVPPQGSDGNAVVLYNDYATNTRCESTSGSATLSQGGGVGSYLLGQFTVSTWQANPGYSCAIAAPSSGSFMIVRAADDRLRNDGKQTDTVTLYDDSILTASLTENNVSPNDPLLAAEYSVSSNIMYVTIFLLADRPNGMYLRTFYIDFPSPAVGSYTGPGVGFTISASYTAAGTLTNCSPSSGTLNITNLGPVGGPVSGNFSVTVPATPGCPTAIDGSFTATRTSDF